MEFGIFFYIAGIASLLGLILQVLDAFPEYREVRKIIFFMVLGVFIGTILSSLQRISFKFDVPISTYYILLLFALLIISSLAIIGSFTKDYSTRMHIFTASGLGLSALLIFLFGYAIYTTNINKPYITNDELMILADKNMEKGNIDRAITILEILKQELYPGDPRIKMLDEKINELKNKKL